MSQFRVRYKDGEFEVEVESTEKSYVDSKLEELLSGALQKTKTGTTEPRVRKKRGQPKKATRKAATTNESPGESPGVDVARLVDAVHEAEGFEDIEKYVLEKSAQLPRVLLCCYFADSLDPDDPYISVTAITEVTDRLGKRIQMSNVSTTVGNNRKYFTADGARKLGARPRYKINRSGKTAFEKARVGEKLS